MPAVRLGFGSFKLVDGMNKKRVSAHQHTHRERKRVCMTIAVSFIHRFRNTFSNIVCSTKIVGMSAIHGCVDSIRNGLVWWSLWSWLLVCVYVLEMLLCGTMNSNVDSQQQHCLPQLSLVHCLPSSSPKPLTIMPPPPSIPIYGSTTAQLKSNDRQFQLNVATNVHILQLLLRIKYQLRLVCTAFRAVEL